MRRLFAATILMVTVSGAAAGEPYWPQGANWSAVSPSEAGFDAQPLQAAVDYALGENTLGMIVLREGRIVAEAYAPQWGRDRRHEIFSACKSVLATLIGMQLDEGKIKSLDQSASDFIPQWKGTDKEKITLRHLLSMTSGLDPRGLQARNVQGDQLAINAAAPLAHPPGTHWQYNTPGYHLVFHIVAKAAGEPFETYAQRKLIVPLGMENWAWVMNRGSGAQGEVSNYYSSECTTRDMARLGLWALGNGNWQGKQLVSASFFSLATAPSQDLNPSYGLLWWNNAREGSPAAGATSGRPPALQFPGSPRDTFAALGAQNQLILVVPSQRLVVVRQGEAPKSAGFTAQLLKQVVDSLAKATR